jgi:hypothetical protein
MRLTIAPLATDKYALPELGNYIENQALNNSNNRKSLEKRQHKDTTTLIKCRNDF